MESRYRDQNRQQNQQGPAGDVPTVTGGPGAAGDEARRRARRLLEIGDAAIGRALSEDSERFLSHNRQQGGE